MSQITDWEENYSFLFQWKAMGDSGRVVEQAEGGDRGGWPCGERALIYQIKYEVKTKQPNSSPHLMFSYLTPQPIVKLGHFKCL